VSTFGKRRHSSGSLHYVGSVTLDGYDSDECVALQLGLARTIFQHLVCGGDCAGPRARAKRKAKRVSRWVAMRTGPGPRRS
jgi:hypothetical protein